MNRGVRRPSEAAAAPSGPDREALRERLARDQRFRVLSVDGLHWIDPHTGILVEAAFGWEQAALEWLEQHRPWERQQPHPLSELAQLKWRHHLRAKLADEPRLRRFDSEGRWLNPYTASWVEGVRRDGTTITKHTIADIAEILAACPEAEGGHLRSDVELERAWLTGDGPQGETTPKRASSYSAPATAGNRLRIKKRRRTTEGDGTRIPGYELLETIGSGGMSTVYRARQLSIDRQVALKVLRPAGERAEAFAERFMREARAAGRIDHPHVVRVFDVGRASGLLYMSMELMAGSDSEAAMSRRGRPFSEQEALAVIRAAATGVAVIHEHGIIHRDIKPSNIFLDRSGVAKIGDLGMAKHGEAENTVTIEGAAVGTPAYMAPEQARAREAIDHRVDIYALGASLYSLLAGRPPFTGPNVFAIVRQVVSEPFPDVRRRNRAVGPATIELIERATARDRDHRYADCAALIAAIDQAMAADPQTDVDAIEEEVETVSIDADGTARIRRHRRHSSTEDGSTRAASLRRLDELGWSLSVCPRPRDQTEDQVLLPWGENLLVAVVATDVPGSIKAVVRALEASLSECTPLEATTAEAIAAHVRRHGPEAESCFLLLGPDDCSCATIRHPAPVLIETAGHLRVTELTGEDSEAIRRPTPGSRILVASPGLVRARQAADGVFDASQLAALGLIHQDDSAELLARRLLDESETDATGTTEDAWALVVERLGIDERATGELDLGQD